VRLPGRGWQAEPAVIVGLGLLALAIGCAALAGVLAPRGPNRIDMGHALAPPAFLGGMWAHALGTDVLGRDILVRLIYGTRISLFVGVVTVSIAAPIGVAVGLLAGYIRGGFGDAMMRLADIQLAIPTILLAIALITALGPGLQNVIVALSITGWPTYARLVRSEALVTVQLDYIEAARAIGTRHRRILLRHILPNVITPAIVYATFAAADMIILEATLSFLGLGVPARVVTWGSMLNDGRQYLTTAWWITAFPGLAIFITVLAINLLGDTLRDRLDPRLSNLL
jgi:peptide/nickel transport system permease protein